MRAASSVVIFCFLILTGCDISPEERANIALASCNVLSEYSENDRALRLKEVNAAREKLNEPLFLGSSEDIQEALLHEVCTALVLNDPTFEAKLAEAKELRAQKFAEFLEGHWVDYSKAERSEDPFIYVAEFTGENLILNLYDWDEDEVIRTQKSIFQTQILNENTVTASRAQGDDFTVSVDVDSKTLRLNSSYCAKSGGCSLEKPPQLTAADLNGKWLVKSDLEGDRLNEVDEYNIELLEYQFPALTVSSRYINQTEKTFEDYSYTCSVTLESGFIVNEICEESESADASFSGWFIEEYNPVFNEMKVRTLFYPSWREARVEDSYTFPEPPKGYTNATKN